MGNNPNAHQQGLANYTAVKLCSAALSFAAILKYRVLWRVFLTTVVQDSSCQKLPIGTCVKSRGEKHLPMFTQRCSGKIHKVKLVDFDLRRYRYDMRARLMGD